MQTNRFILILMILVLFVAPTAASRTIPPTKADVPYGPHPRQVLDFWKAKSEGPSPIVVFFHGGRFTRGDKSSLEPKFLKMCLKAGISVASANYRFTTDAPLPGPMLDAARAVQFLRLKAAGWNLDPEKVAAFGNSAGGGIALWLAFHEDLSQPESDDPVTRESTRLSCVAAVSAQASYDPRFLKETIGGKIDGHVNPSIFFGLSPEEANTPSAYKLFEETSPITHVTKDDPPVFLFFSKENKPITPDINPRSLAHHSVHGLVLKKKLESLGIPCSMRYGKQYGSRPYKKSRKEIVRFLEKHLKKK